MTNALFPLQPIDYLIIGHITQDITPSGYTLGGTASYAALTARACGLRVGVVTSCAPDAPLDALNGIPLSIVAAEQTTTFENIPTPFGRIQRLHHRAELLDYSHVPVPWRSAKIVHLAPIAQEVDPTIVRYFSNAILGVTPQGWMRTWDSAGRVSFTDWTESSFVLERSDIAVMSIEDVLNDESRIEALLASIRILAVTEGAAGARIYWNGDVRNFRPPQVKEVDPTGAGDIFAASFMVRYHLTRDPWEAARFANCVAATSVTRPGIQGVPTSAEVNDHILEILPGN